MADITRNGDQEINIVDKTSQQAATIDTSTSALNGILYAHHEIHSGSHYFVKRFTEISGASTTTDFLAIAPDTTKWIHALSKIQAESEFTLFVYEGASVSANGSSVTSFNNNRNSANSSTLALFDNPTLNTTGTLIWSAKVGSGHQTGGVDRADTELIMKQNTKYLVRHILNVPGPAWINTEFQWYEHTNKA